MSWRGLDHATIYEMVMNQGDGPEISRPAEDGWRRIQDVILDAESGIRAAMRATENEWEGSGANAMRTGYTPLGEWVLSAAADASRTVDAVTEQAAMAANTRRLVAGNAPPQNVGEHLHSFFGGLDGDSVHLDQAGRPADDHLRDGVRGQQAAPRHLERATDGRRHPGRRRTVRAWWCGGRPDVGHR